MRHVLVVVAVLAVLAGCSGKRPQVPADHLWTDESDEQAVTQALAAFQDIVDRYPGTPWAERAALRVRECRESLAAHDAGIADFYLVRGALLAAESRLRGLVSDYPETDATASTLH